MALQAADPTGHAGARRYQQFALLHYVACDESGDRLADGVSVGDCFGEFDADVESHGKSRYAGWARRRGRHRRRRFKADRALRKAEDALRLKRAAVRVLQQVTALFAVLVNQ